MFRTIIAILTFVSFQAYAGKCVLTTTRVACSAATESESYSKCGGKASCDEETTAMSEKDCGKKALKGCENARLNITKSKTITATFDGKPVEGGKNFCAADRPDFNKCSK